MEEGQGLNLSVLFPLLGEMPPYRALQEALGQGGEAGASLLEAAKPCLLAALHRELALPVLVVVASPEEARKLYEQLQAWGVNGLHLLPEPDALPYERLTPDAATVQERLEALRSLAQDKAPLVVTSAWALAQKTIPHSDFLAASQTLSTGMTIELSQLLARWHRLGYEMEAAVEVPGTASRRGGILDIYPVGGGRPVRLELAGNRIESLRHFDPLTQRSQEKIASVSILPAREMLIPEMDGAELLDRLELAQLDEAVREIFETDIGRLLEGQWFPTLEFYAPLFNTGSVLDYLSSAALVVWDEPSEIEMAHRELASQAEELRQQRASELPPGFPTPYFSWPEIQDRAEKLSRRLLLTRWQDGKWPALPFAAPPSYGGQWPAFLKSIKQMLREKQAVLILSQQAQRLSEILAEEDIIAPPLPGLSQPPPPGSISLVQGSLDEGFVMDTAQQRLTLLSDAEVFGFVKKRRWPRKHPVRHQAFLAELAVGDYVVHEDHGIGRFAGMARMGTAGEEKEYLVLEYAAGDKLYVPTDMVDRVSRYVGPGGPPPTLSRLGTQEWQRTRQRVKEAVAVMARELLELYASREVLPGFAFSPDSPWQQELEASFSYVETPDQMDTIHEVKADMEKPRPMDRLVCGDVGYGKTEVALRAAFKAVQDGKQVAVLVPTTVLAQQHFATFSQRLAAFPVKVEMLSRFRSAQEQKEVVQGLAQGSVDICIGTHRLLQKDVAFKNLGLVIIDEEQRFGVAHKERLKKMRQEVDVLTLSATPIPRTLHISLMGVRDMSTMETPPEERLPIKTYVAEYDDRLVREAILRELERGGQVFFVHNRVQTIGRVARHLQQLVPEARIAIAHGQMPEEGLEKVMAEFSAGKSDVLVCTTIIESGLDMPSVNTLIIHDANRLGLTQLYQLRGRVGRGSLRAYAYFLYARNKRLTEAAQKRLKTISEATELGAGFRIAMKDLEIRGAGNILGAEQSGHIYAVGFDLYGRLLAEAVEELRARQRGEPSKGPLPPAPSVDLPLPAHIPKSYIEDVGTRLNFYQRLAKIASPGEIDGLVEEMQDRFGALPPPVKNLLFMVRIKALAARAGIAAIASEDGDIVLRLRDGQRPGRALEALYQGAVKVGTTQVRLERRRLGKSWPQVLERLISSLLRESGQPER